MAELRCLVVVLGDQLDLDAAAFDGFDSSRDAVWMAEVAQESTHVWSSKARTAMFLATMRHFGDALQASGRPLHYTRLGAPGIRVNLDSAVFMLQAWITALKGEPGAAVFASSVVARIGVANHEAIAAAKGGVEALVRSAAAAYASQGLRVNAVAPGMTETPMTAGMLKMPAMREGAGRQYPLGGVQTADQVADVMAWLLGDGAARLTGQVIAVDGGFTTVRPLVK